MLGEGGEEINIKEEHKGKKLGITIEWLFICLRAGLKNIKQ